MARYRRTGMSLPISGLLGLFLFWGFIFMKPYSLYGQSLLSRDPVTNVMQRRMLGIPTLGDHIAQSLNTLRNLNQVQTQIGERISQVRARFWNSYPNGSDFAAARAEFEANLRSKDYILLMSRIAGIDNSAAGIIYGSNIDGGVPEGAANMLDQWTLEVMKHLGYESTNDHGVMTRWLGNPAGMRAQIDKADHLYKAFVLRRTFEEYRRQGKRPPDVDPEAWRLAMIAMKVREADTFKDSIGDPYGDAFAAFEKGASFPRQCGEHIQEILRTSVSAKSCSCLLDLFTQELRPSELWKLETKFSDATFLAASVSKIGLHEKVTACLH